MWSMYIIPYRIEIPLDFELTKTGTIHGLAFWFEIAFIGTRYVISMVCMSPVMSPLPSCFVKRHSMVVYCSTPANHSLASGMLCIVWSTVFISHWPLLTMSPALSVFNWYVAVQRDHSISNNLEQYLFHHTNTELKITIGHWPFSDHFQRANPIIC